MRVLIAYGGGAAVSKYLVEVPVVVVGVFV